MTSPTFKRLRLAGLVAALGIAAPLVAGFLTRWHPAFDLFANFRVHLAVLLMLAALPLIALRLFANGAAALLLGLAALATTGQIALPGGFGPPAAAWEPRGDAAIYRVMHLNLLFNNWAPEKVLSLIGRVRPDVITLDEVSQPWVERLALLSAAYPHRLICQPPSPSGGVAILSLRPFAEGSAGECLSGGIMAKASIDFGGRAVDVAELHLHKPWPGDQLAQIDDLAGTFGELAETAILGGDLNAAPWTLAARRVAAATGMTESGIRGPTWWHWDLPEALRFLGLSIDHIMVKGDVVVHSARRLEAVGSDHLPLLLEFSLRPAATPENEAITAALR